MQRPVPIVSQPVEYKEVKLHVIPFPSWPAKVDLADVDDDFRLIPKKEIAAIIEKIDAIEAKESKEASLPVRKFKKSDLGTKYSIIKIRGKSKEEDQFFVIYKGAKHGKLVQPAQKKRRLKFLQNLQSGEIAIEKIQSEEHDIPETEYKNLRVTGDAIAYFTRTSKSKQEEQKIILMKWKPGDDLDAFYAHQTSLSPLRLLDLVIQVLAALQKMHDPKGEIKLLHRDFKLANILKDFISGKLSPVDFAAALELSHESFKGFHGTRGFTAPEVERFSGYDLKYRFGSEADVFSAGKVIAALFGFTFGKNFDLVPRTSSLYRHNHKLSKKHKEAVYQFISEKMLAQSPLSRQQVLECLNFFKNIRKEYITKPNNIAILHVSEFIAASAAERSRMLSALQCADKVWFIETREKFDPKEYLTLFRDKGPMIGNRIFHEPGRPVQDILRDIPRFIAQDRLKRHSPRVSNFFHVTARDLPRDFVEEIKPQHLRVITIKPEKSQAAYKREFLLQQPISEKDRTKIRTTLEQNQASLSAKEKKTSNKATLANIHQQLTTLANALLFLKHDYLTYQDIAEKLAEIKAAMKPTGRGVKLRNALFGKIEQLKFHPTTETKVSDLENELIDTDRILRKPYISRRLF